MYNDNNNNKLYTKNDNYGVLFRFYCYEWGENFRKLDIIWNGMDNGEMAPMALLSIFHYKQVRIGS